MTFPLQTHGGLEVPVWLRAALTTDECVPLDDLSGGAGKPGSRMGSEKGGGWKALDPVTRAIRQRFPGMRPVRLVSFTKDSGTNWGVSWHQDRVIAVAARTDMPGFGNWSRKAGVWHCEPPRNLLDRMLFVRVHLDDCNADNGAMEFAGGSHLRGVIPAKVADDVAGRYATEACAARRGDILILPMLTLHRSLPSTSNAPRRTLRIDYADFGLPSPLAWADGGIVA